MATTTSLVNLPRTILGSLTTTFTAPTSCAYLAAGFVGDDLVGWAGQKCVTSSINGVVDDQACWPGTTAGAAYPHTPFSGWGFYSPGVVCPAGYSSACTATASGNANWPVQFSLEAGETAVGCCPSGYGCTNRVTESGQTCYLLASSTTLTTATCSDGALTGDIMTLPYNPSAAATATESASSTFTMRAWAPMIQINWKASDRSTGAAASESDGTSATTGMSTLTSTAAASSATTTPSSSSSSSSSMSDGAIAGVVVGAVIGVLLIKLAAYFFWRHRRAQRGARGDHSEGGADGTSAPKWQSSGGGQYANALELPDSTDMAVWRTHAEMATAGNLVELPADGHAYPVEVPGQSRFVEAPT